MDLYERIRNEDLSKLSTEEFSEMLNKYEKDFTRLGLPVNEQIEIRNALDEEASRRKFTKDEISNISDEIKQDEAELQRAMLVKNDNTSFVSNFINQDELDKFIKEKQESIIRKETIKNAMIAEKEVSKKSSVMSRKIKLSIINKRIDNGKKIVASIPQRICTLSKRKLNRMYNRVRDAYHKANDNLNERTLSVEDALNGLFKEQENALSVSGITPAQSYIVNKEVQNVADKYFKKYKQIEKEKNVLATLRNGTVRMMNLSRAALDKLRKTQSKDEIIPEISISM